MIIQGIVKQWPSYNVLAADMGLRRNKHVSSFMWRNSILVHHWDRLISAADQRGITSLNYETLVSAHMTGVSNR